ncbi:MAG: MATE family efflux transporter [Spirochaetes bacterium]|nr:MATE family efflux transporter [Spirochaetota bacterium]
MNSKFNLDSDSIGRLLLKFTVPTFFAMLVQTLYHVVDMIFIGHFVGSMAIAGLTIVLPIQLFVVGMGLMTGMGGASLISRLLGRGNMKRAETALGNSILLSVVVALTLSMSGLVNVKLLCRVLGATDTILPYSVDYLRIMLIGMTVATCGFAFSFLIRAGGNPMIPMMGQVLGAVCNIALDAVFLIKLQMGVQGAAWATVLSQVIALLFFLRYYLLGKPAIILRISAFKPDFASIKSILAIGVSSLAMTLANSLCAVFVNRTIVSYGGDIAMSAYGIINQILMFAIMPAIVIGQGIQPIIGFNYGAHRYDRVIKVILTGLGATVTSGVIVFLIVFLIPEAIIGLFTGDNELIMLSAYAVKRVFAVMYLSGFVIIGSSIFQSLGKAVQAFLATISRSVVFLLPLILILPRFFQLDGVWWAFPVNDSLSAVFVIAITIPLIMKLRKLSSVKTGTAPEKGNLI